MKTKKLIKSYNVSAPVNTLASLTKKQARELVGGIEKGEKWLIMHEGDFDNKTFNVNFDYPLYPFTGFNFKIKLGEYASIGELALKIARIYKKVIYRRPSKYGVWGHSINDLSLSRIRVYNDNSIELDVSS